MFGRSSDKRDEQQPDQMPLCNRDADHAAGDTRTGDEIMLIAAYARKKRGRKALP